jgi:GPH family glycoside/pentoside/hexuronide:cation symporter
MAVAAGASYLVGPGDFGFMSLLVVVIGFGLSAHWVAPYAMVPDVIEHDQAATGQRREGMYYGVYGLTDKIMRTLGVFLVGIGLDIVGYIPNVDQTVEALRGIRLIFGPVPAVLLLLVFPLLMRYPIDRESHNRLRQELAEGS